MCRRTHIKFHFYTAGNGNSKWQRSNVAGRKCLLLYLSYSGMFFTRNSYFLYATLPPRYRYFILLELIQARYLKTPDVE